MAEDSRLQEERRAGELAAAIKGLDYEKKDLNKKLQDKDARITGGPQKCTVEKAKFISRHLISYLSIKNGDCKHASQTNVSV